MRGIHGRESRSEISGLALTITAFVKVLVGIDSASKADIIEPYEV